MAARIKSLKDAYEGCRAEGFIISLEHPDKDLVYSLLQSAKEGLERSKKIEKAFEKETDNWAFTFAERYDILRKLLDAFLIFDKVKISNHLCSNAYFCIKHSNLEIDWDTLESIRILRNDINYKGIKISKDKWKFFKLKFDIYINTFIKEIEKKLSD